MSGFGLAKTPDDSKFRELVLYICRMSEGDAPFGAVKLNKLLFYADFLAYRQLGHAITWHVYQRLENGPAPRRLLPILEKMEDRGDIATGEVRYHGFIQKRTCALREPDLSRFTGEEIALVDGLIADCWGKNAKTMSEMSHAFRGWSQARDGENIPYEIALLQFEKPTEAQLDQGVAMADELRALAGECADDDD
ncbi:MAG TPA: Panacea domain-containing protein [Pirellulales bacterium]|nr:Panacea domain-containing protein [Pirellulales bacterium]